MGYLEDLFEIDASRLAAGLLLVFGASASFGASVPCPGHAVTKIPSSDVLPLIIPAPRDACLLGDVTNLAGARVHVLATDDPRIAHAEMLLNQAFGEPATHGSRIELKLLPVGQESTERYFLKIDRGGATVTAASGAGLLYGVITLVQMRGLAHSTVLPNSEIHDVPDLPYRAVMLDIGRNYIPIAQLKEQIEIFSNYKINTFHWHLTDDPAWRFEVKSHPELTTTSSMDPDYAPGKFYSQAEIRDIIAFSRARNITVVPEIDFPGHAGALRRALGVNRMDDPKVAVVLRDAFRELLNLAPSSEVPFVHIGSDEVRSPEERMPQSFIKEIAGMIHRSGRRAILWSPGLKPPTADARTIQMLWGTGKPDRLNPYIDARALYASVYTGFDAVRTPFWDAPARDGYGKRFGGEMAIWFDLPNHNTDIERIAPFWPAVLTFADRAWDGGKFRGDLLVKRPREDSPEQRQASAFDNAIVANRDVFFHSLPFPYIRDLGYWRILGPLPNGGNFDKAFGPEQSPASAEAVTVDKEIYEWNKTARGAHVFLKQMWFWPGALDDSKPQMVPWPTSQEERSKSTNTTVYARAIIESDSDRDTGFWVQVDPPNPSDRRAGPNPTRGEWSRSRAKIWINGTEIEPPEWKTPGLGARPVWHDPIPITDEFYYLRPSIQVRLHKGANVILLRLPDAGVKWEFVCTPVEWDGIHAHEVEGVRFKEW